MSDAMKDGHQNRKETHGAAAGRRLAAVAAATHATVLRGAPAVTAARIASPIAIRQKNTREQKGLALLATCKLRWE